MKCAGLDGLLVVLMVLRCVLHCRAAFSLSAPECQSGGELSVYTNRDTTLHCYGLNWDYNIYWVLAEQNLGECLICKRHHCDTCTSYNDQYQLSRTTTQSTITFRPDGDIHEGAELTCRSFSYHASASCRLKVRYEFSLLPSDCSSDKKQITVMEGDEASFTCFGLGRAFNVYWSLSRASEGEQRIGDCTGCADWGCPHCSTYAQGAGYTLHRDPKETVLRFQASWERQDDSTVKCSSFNNHTTVSCRLRVYRQYQLPQCQHGKLDLVENGQDPPKVTCVQLSEDQTFLWVVNPGAGNTPITASTCPACIEGQPCSQQCQSDRDDFAAVRTAYNSTLTIVRNLRALAKQTVNCFLNDQIKAWCEIRVLSYPRLSDLTVTLHGNWTVTGSVTYQQAFSSDGHVYCAWYQAHDKQPDQRLPLSAVKMSQYEDNGSGQTFYTGSCVMVTSLTTSEGLYQFKADLWPGSGLFAVGSVVVKKPGSLGTELNSCPQIVIEGQNISCTCSYPDESQPVPPATIKWANTTATPTTVLELRDVSRAQTGRVYVCTSEWGPGGEVTDSVKYSFDVVYGPVEATVTQNESSTNDLGSLTLTCKVPDVFPSAVFAWGGVTCVNVSQAGESSSCTVDRATVKGAREVVCVAVNSKLSGLNVSTYFSLPSSEKMTSDDSPLPIIGGAVAGAVVVAVIITAILIVFIRRKRIRSKSSPRPWTNLSRPADNGNESREYINDMYESSDTLPQPDTPECTLAGRQASTDQCSSVYDVPRSPIPLQAADRVYDNIAQYANSGTSATSENAAVSEQNCVGKPETSADVSGDVYTQVQKKPKQEGIKDQPAPKTQNADEDTQDLSNVYAEVDKKKKKKTKEKTKKKERTTRAKGKAADDTESSATCGKKECTEQEPSIVNPQPDSVVYENYDAKGKDSEEVYMNVDQLSSTAEEEYNRLHFARVSTGDPNPVYNHLTMDTPP